MGNLMGLITCESAIEKNPEFEKEQERLKAAGSEVMDVIKKHNLTAGQAFEILDYVKSKINNELSEVFIGEKL